MEDMKPSTDAAVADLPSVAPACSAAILERSMKMSAPFSGGWVGWTGWYKQGEGTLEEMRLLQESEQKRTPDNLRWRIIQVVQVFEEPT